MGADSRQNVLLTPHSHSEMGTIPAAAHLDLLQASKTDLLSSSPTYHGHMALISMPWGSIAKPSLAMAVLKPWIEKSGFQTDLHFLNMRFASQIGLELYESIADGFFYPEWFFSPALFGPKGTAQMQNSWSDIKASKAGVDLSRQLTRLVGGSEELCAKIAQEFAPQFIESCMTGIDWSKYQVVGFTTTFAQSVASLLLAKRIKEVLPKISIVFGGANVDSEMGVEFLSGFPWIDYVVHGEAEQSFPALLKNIAAGRSQERVAGISLRKDDGLLQGDGDAGPVVNLNESPIPDYSDYVNELDRFGFRKKLTLQLCYESSRGCWWGAKHHCTFCGLNGTTMSFRKKDPDRVFSEILDLSTRYRCLSFTAADNILAMDYFTELLPRLAEVDSDIQLFYEVKANLTREQVRMLKAAGIRRIQPGIESFNSRILSLMRKGVTAIQNIQLLKWCYELEIDSTYNMLYGFPGETADDYKDLPGIFRLLSHLRAPSGMARVMFERFSPYFFDKDRFRLQLRPLAAYSLIFPGADLDLARLAYFFEGEWEGQKGVPEDYLGPALAEWQAWVKRWEAENTFCYYSKGPDYLVIHDNRPTLTDGVSRIRRIHMDEKISAIYLYCDEHRSMQSICEMAGRRFGAAADDSKVRLWLDQMVFQGLMFREKDRYLALAVRKKPHQHQRQKATF